jgi:hypothetical protein
MNFMAEFVNIADAMALLTLGEANLSESASVRLNEVKLDASKNFVGLLTAPLYTCELGRM